LPFVLLSMPNNVCTMFCAATMLLLCCAATMLCCHVLLSCYVVVLGLSLCSVVTLVVMCVLSYIYFKKCNPRALSPQEAFW
jgi:hypothetical protein